MTDIDWYPGAWTEAKDHEPTVKIPVVQIPSAVITGELPVWSPEELFHQDLQRARLEAEDRPSRFRLTAEFAIVTAAGVLLAAAVIAVLGVAILAAQPAEETTDTTFQFQQLGQFEGAESTTVTTPVGSTTAATAASRTTPETKRETVISAPATAATPTTTAPVEPATTRQAPTTTAPEQPVVTPAPTPATDPSTPATDPPVVAECTRIGEPSGDGQGEWVQNPNPPGGCVIRATTTTATERPTIPAALEVGTDG